MKYAHLAIGLLIGTALGGSVVAATLENPTGTALNQEEIKKIVREVISEEPQLILDSVQKMQDGKRQEAAAGANEALKDKEVQEALLANAAFIGPEDSKKVVVEFFDYNCPACKMQYKELEKLVTADKGVKVVFKEYPIFGPSSDANAKIGLAVNALYPEKYFAFHGKMMRFEGRADTATAYKFAKELGMDEAKLKAQAAKPEMEAILDADRQLGSRLNLQGTPSLVVNGELIGHAMGQQELQAKLEQ